MEAIDSIRQAAIARPPSQPRRSTSRRCRSRLGQDSQTGRSELNQQRTQNARTIQPVDARSPQERRVTPANPQLTLGNAPLYARRTVASGDSLRYHESRIRESRLPGKNKRVMPATREKQTYP